MQTVESAALEAAGIEPDAAEPERRLEPVGSHPPKVAAPAPQPRSSPRRVRVPASAPDAADVGGVQLVTATPTVRIVEMTPARAAAIIEGCNRHNRNCEDRRIAQYARDMRAGGWMFTGEAIKISREGVLLDGQHRLYGVIDAGRTVPLLVITGLDPRAQEVMDQGIPRRLHDALALRGEPDPNNLAAALRMVAHFYRDGVPFQMGGTPGMSHGFALRLLDRGTNRDDLQASLRFVRNHRKGQWSSLSQLAALHFLFAAADAERADAFMLGLLEDSGMEWAARSLRGKLIEEYHAQQRDGTPRAHLKTRTVFVVMAWNAGDGDAPEFKWKHGDGFPGIRGLSDDLELADRR